MGPFSLWKNSHSACQNRHPRASAAGKAVTKPHQSGLEVRQRWQQRSLPAKVRHFKAFRDGETKVSFGSLLGCLDCCFCGCFEGLLFLIFVWRILGFYGCGLQRANENNSSAFRAPPIRRLAKKTAETIREGL